MPGTLSPSPWLYFADENGQPYAGALLFTYAAGTTTKLATYTDSDLSVPHANPATLDAAGRITLYLTAASYKFVLAPATDTDPPTSPYKTQDHIDAVSATADNLDVTGTAGETLLVGEAVYLSAGDGGLTAGAWYKADADQSYSSSTAAIVGVAAQTIVSGASGAIRIQGRMTGLSGLIAGSNYYVSATAGGLTATAPTNRRLVGMAESATVLFVVPMTSSLPPGITTDGTTVTGITFPATQVPSANANTLDDYEEGTWTPTIGGSTSASGQVYASQTGYYVKVGKCMHLWYAVTLSTLGTITGNVQIQSLPFAIANVTAGAHGASPMAWGLTTTAVVNMLALPIEGASALTVVIVTAATTNVFASAATQANLANGTLLRGQLIYQASA